MGCPWNESTCSTAALQGRLEFLKYAHENGCQWNQDTSTNAALSLNLDCLKYVCENGCPYDISHMLAALKNFYTSHWWVYHDTDSEIYTYINNLQYM